MNIYSIYINPQKKDNDFIIIKQGFSAFAGLLNVFWALYYKMWLPLIVTLMFMIVILTINNTCLIYISKILMILIYAFCNDDIREYDLERKNYRLGDVILAKSEIEAELKFLQRLEENSDV